MAVTWANLKTVFYGVVGDVEGENTFFSTAQVVGWAQECLREAGERTHFYDLKYENAGTADDPYVTFTSVIYGVWRVEVDDEPMRPITGDKLRHGDRFWESRTGTARWYLLDEYQTDIDQYKIRLYETPSADYEVTIYAYGQPTLMSDSNPTYNVHLPEWFAYSLVWGMLAKAYSADTQMRNEQIAGFFKSIWEDAVMRLRVRSFGRLKNEWAYQPAGPEIAMSIWDRLPTTITEP